MIRPNGQLKEILQLTCDEFKGLVSMKFLVFIEKFSFRPGVTQCASYNFYHNGSCNYSTNQRYLKHGKPHFFKECPIVGLIENPTCINCGKQEHLTKPSSWQQATVERTFNSRSVVQPSTTKLPAIPNSFRSKPRTVSLPDKIGKG
ncbi:hypothetical protein CEXT_292181 [Caerostris extrusa]|uniref:Uncharacterized protein n=1 Tax=Caerostris extrusa TaxID=172846 RepID=A0AAV4VTI8_CAEEX|nr:hypothetical protein CEXT_292181 [Caerostris extrusa]